MSTQRQPKGIPTGGQFAASTHDEASAGLPSFSVEEGLEAADLNEGDIIDMTRNVVNALKSGGGAETGVYGRQIVRKLSYDEKEDMPLIVLEDSTGTRRNWLVADEDTFDRVPPRDDSYQVAEPGEIDAGDYIDMTRTIDEYITNPYRGDGYEATEMSVNRNKVYRVTKVDDDGGDLTIHMENASDPSDTLSWYAPEGLSDFDLVNVDRDASYPMKTTL